MSKVNKEFIYPRSDFTRNISNVITFYRHYFHSKVFGVCLLNYFISVKSVVRKSLPSRNDSVVSAIAAFLVNGWQSHHAAAVR